MEAAIKKYNTIGERMANKNESPMVLGETAPSRFIKKAARLRKKAFQREISHVDTRVNIPSITHWQYILWPKIYTELNLV